jgi:hypothetical protein
MRHREENILKNQAQWEDVTISPRNPMECARFFLQSVTIGVCFIPPDAALPPEVLRDRAKALGTAALQAS